MSISSMMESVCIVQRATTSRGARGGTVPDPYTPITVPNNTNPLSKGKLPCSYQEQSGKKQDEYGQWNTFVTSTVYFAQDPGCEANDLLIITNKRTGEVVKLIADGVSQPIGRGRQYQVTGERIREPV